MIDSYMSSDAAVAIAGARAGADVVREMYGRRLNRIDKGAGDFATTADVEAEKAILGVIRAARPDDAVLGEEGGQQGAAGAVRQWLVDPLCGTLNYAVGNMLVAVNVALRDGAAAVADPFTGEIFCTDGKTARVWHDGADDALLTPTPNASGRASSPRPWRWPGSLPASAPRMSPTAATCPAVCISPPASLCAGLPAASSPGSTVPRSMRGDVGLWPPPMTIPTGC